MIRPHALLLCLWLGAGLPAAPAAATASRPNVIFLFADDFRFDSVAALGNPAVKTPNLDALVKRGFVFNNAYCLGGNSAAVCTPSRNMLLSGRTYFRWPGNLAPADPPNFPLTLRERGYLTYHHGKRGNSALSIQAKFEINRYLDEEADRISGEPGREIVDAAIRFIQARPDRRPFFMYLAFGNPHDPRVAARSYMDLYDPARIPLPKSFLPQHPFDNGELRVRDELLLPWPRTPAAVRGQLHEYYAVITALDGHMGRLLKVLRDLGQLENTLVIFSADQGVALGSHGLLGKQNLYDAAMKVPLIMAGPGIAKGRSEALVYLHDIYPTIAELVGAPAPLGIDGLSFLPVLQGRVKSVRPELFLAYRQVQRAVRDDRWKLICYPEINHRQLFDLKRDPNELKNCAEDPGQAARVAALTARLVAWQSRMGDALPLRVEHPKPRWVDLSRAMPTGDERPGGGPGKGR